MLANKVLNRWYRRLAKEAGVRRIASHGARHTAGSSYAVMGAGQKVIGALLGHSDSASTESYTHIAPSATTALVQRGGCGWGAGRVGGESERKPRSLDGCFQVYCRVVDRAPIAPASSATGGTMSNRVCSVFVRLTLLPMLILPWVQPGAAVAAEAPPGSCQRAA